MKILEKEFLVQHRDHGIALSIRLFLIESVCQQNSIQYSISTKYKE